MNNNKNNAAKTNLAMTESTDAQSNISVSKRALLTKGWIVPVVVGVSLPVSGFAANISSDEEFPGN
jgi:hypothetical protein